MYIYLVLYIPLNIIWVISRWWQFSVVQLFQYYLLTLVLLNPDILFFANSVDPDQLASEEANWSGSALFAIKYTNL